MEPKYEKYINALNEHCEICTRSLIDFTLSQLNMRDDIIDPLRRNSNIHFTWENGATKLVLLPRDEDFVIKIPFTGYWDEDDYESNMRSYERAEDRGEEPEEIIDTDFYYEFTYASIDEDDPECWDYCRLECAIYEKAAAAGLARYFAKEEIIGYLDDFFPIYAQEKVSAFSKVYDKDIGQRTSKRCEELNVDCIHSMWVHDFFEIYGEEEYVKLANFLKEEDLWDFHGGNIGYRNGKPILMDYSGYND